MLAENGAPRCPAEMTTSRRAERERRRRGKRKVLFQAEDALEWPLLACQELIQRPGPGTTGALGTDNRRLLYITHAWLRLTTGVRWKQCPEECGAGKVGGRALGLEATVLQPSRAGL